MITNYPSRLLERAVANLSKLPGVGRKTALRLALHLLRVEPGVALELADAIAELRRNVCYCARCHNISDTPVCDICSDKRRDQSTICVVENVRDVLTIESTHEHNGLYHVLGGLVSPMDGIGPSELEIDSLIERVHNEDIAEVILALPPTMEGDTTAFYIYRRLSGTSAHISVLARGVAVGSDLEYTDELTLGRSLVQRIPFADSISSPKQEFPSRKPR